MKIALLLLSLCFAPIVFMTGCQTPTTQTQPSGDPVVVNAERTIAISFETIDAFLKWERANQSIVPPNVAAFAFTLRIKAPDQFRNARSVLRAYKGNKTPEQRVLLDQWLAALSESARIAQTYNTR